MEQKPQGEPFEEKLEQELYKEVKSGRVGRVKKVWGVKRKEPASQEFWQEKQTERLWFFPIKKFFWPSFILFLISFTIFLFVFYFRQIQISGININITGAPEISSLSPQEYRVTIKNSSKFLLDESVLNVTLNDGGYFVQENSNRIGHGEAEGSSKSETTGRTANQKTISLGSLSPNQQIEVPLRLFFTGKTNQVIEIKAVLNYLSPKKNQRFSVEKNLAVTVKKAVFDFQTHFPNQVFVGEPFQLSFRFSNITNQPFDLRVQVENPGNFESISYSPPYEAISQEKLLSWDFSNFQPNSASEIIVIGKFIQEPLNPIFTIRPTITFQNQTLTAQSIPVAVTAINSPIVIAIKSQPEGKLLDLNRIVTYTVNWENKSSINLEDARLKVDFEGPFDLGDLRSDGYFSAFENALIWDARNNSKLYKILPGESGSVNFSVKVVNNYPVFSPNQKDFRLRVKATFETKSIPPEVQILSRQISIEAEETKFLPGDISVLPVIRYRDNLLSNYGPFPPVAGGKTALTAHLYVDTIAEDFQNVIIKTKIPIGVQLTGVWGGNFEASLLSFNRITGDFVYQIKQLPANLGNGYQSYDLAFQIEATPPIADPREVEILGPVELEAVGRHSQKIFKVTTRPVKLNNITE